MNHLPKLIRSTSLTKMADAAAEKLKAMINVTATVVRDGKEEEIPLKQLVPGDVVKLSAGDMIPADVRLIEANDLFITQGTLTGESLPVEKLDTRETKTGISPLELVNICFLGTSVESGAATTALLADPAGDAALLRRPHSDCENVADPQGVAVKSVIRADVTRDLSYRWTV